MPDPRVLPPIEQVRVVITYAASLDEDPHDVHLLEGRLREPMRPLESTVGLEALLHQVASDESARARVRVCTTRELGADTHAEAEVAIALQVPAGWPRREEDTAAAREALRELSGRLLRPDETPTPNHDRALAEARDRLTRAYPDLTLDTLRVTDEEHHHAVWSVTLIDETMNRYEVSLGSVDGGGATTHIRRRTASEVVDSVGTG